MRSHPATNDELVLVCSARFLKALRTAADGGWRDAHDGTSSRFHLYFTKWEMCLNCLFCFVGLTHEEAARLIANAYADRSVPELKLLMSPSTFRPNANYQPENWWWRNPRSFYFISFSQHREHRTRVPFRTIDGTHFIRKITSTYFLQYR